MTFWWISKVLTCCSFMQAFFFFFGLQVLCQAQCMSVMDSALWCDNCVCVMGEVKYLP